MPVAKSFSGPPFESVRKSSFALFLLLLLSGPALAANSWKGILRDASGHAVSDATVSLQANSGAASYSAKTSASGEFLFADIAAQRYQLAVEVTGKLWKAADPLTIKDGDALAADRELSAQNQTLAVLPRANVISQQISGGEVLSSGQVSSLPLNERDFSKLLLLAAGTMTDTNGAANFTQQFTVNGLRGSTAVFAMDGADTSDPELGGATFSNFNVDAIQEVQSSSGVMPAEIGHGAAGFTNVITKSGTDQVHGSAFEFVRNAAFDARNFFDHKSDVDTRRLPPFVRNELASPTAAHSCSREFTMGAQDFLLWRIPGFSPGTWHNASLRRPQRRRTQWHRHHHFPRRHPDRPRESRHRAAARSLSSPE
jgi:hypothetical protein